MKIRGMFPLWALLAVGLGSFLLLVLTQSLAYFQGDKTNLNALNEAARKAPLSSVLVRGDEVFAANDCGIYRASIQDKKWSRLRTPRLMPAKGHFAHIPKDSNHLLYFFATLDADKLEPGQGLYDSTDGGLSWRLISGDHRFKEVLLHRDGSLYAIVQRPEEAEGGIRWNSSILRAPAIADPPQWKDITGKLGTNMPLFDLFEDPDHPGLVCLHASGLRGYVVQAQDKNYDWKMTREWDWPKHPETEEAFFRQGYLAESFDFPVQANLANYFDYPFGNETVANGLTVRTKAANFTFAKDNPKVISIAIDFLQGKQGALLVDLVDDLEFWAIRVVTPTGEQVSRCANDPRSKEEEQKAMDKVRDRKDLARVEVKAGKPYERTLDLDRLSDFSKPGVYKVLISYYNGSLPRDPNDEWRGAIDGQVFTVTIR